jgi:dTDP-glucose 4,6-dehydratase
MTQWSRPGLRDADEKAPLKLHVAGEREISNLDLAQMIAGFIGKPLRYKLQNFHESRPGHDLRYALDGSKIRAMGWQQPLDIEQSLENVVRWYLRDENRRWLSIGSKVAV